MPTRGVFRVDTKSVQKELEKKGSMVDGVVSDMVRVIGRDFIDRVKKRMPYRHGILYERGLKASFGADSFVARVHVLQSERQRYLARFGKNVVPGPSFRFRENPLGGDWEFGFLVDAGGAYTPYDRQPYFEVDKGISFGQGFFSDSADAVKNDWSDERRLVSHTRYSDLLE